MKILLTEVNFEKLPETQSLGHVPCNSVNNVLLMDSVVIVSTLPLRNTLQLQLTIILACMYRLEQWALGWIFLQLWTFPSPRKHSILAVMCPMGAYLMAWACPYVLTDDLVSTN